MTTQIVTRPRRVEVATRSTSTVRTGTRGIPTGDVTRIVRVTQAEYEAQTPDSSTLYLVIG